MIEYKTQEMQMIPYKDRRKIEKKVLPEYYKGIRTHKKMFELRKDEDGIKPGDILVLREWDGGKYTGGMTRREVTAVLKDCPEYGLMNGYCILSLQTPGWDFVKPSAEPEYKELQDWKTDFKGFIDALDMPRDDYRGIIEYIDEVPSTQPKTQKLLDDGTLIVHTDFDITKIIRVNITQNNTHYGDLFYRDEE